MTMFLIQSAILLAIAFVLGAIIGCLLKRMFASDDVSVPAATAAATAAVATAALASKPDPEPVRVAVKPEPMPEPAPAAPVMAAAPVIAAKPKTKPKPKAAPKPKVAAASVKDDLKLIVGIGPVNERKLNQNGVSQFAQIASWNKADVIDAEKYLEFDGRIEREEWIRQAKNLAAGGKPDASGKRAPRKASTAAKMPSAVASTTKAVTAKSATAKSTPVKSSVPKATAVGLIGSGNGKKVATPPAKPAAKSSAEKKPASKSATAKPASKPKPDLKPKAAKPAAEKKPMALKLDKPIGGKPDNLTLINGIGNVIEKRLHEMGVFHFEQIANWNDQQAEHFSKAVGFPGRAKRESWMKEAAIFMKGGTTEHARKVEAGAIPTSRKSTAAEKGKK